MEILEIKRGSKIHDNVVVRHLYIDMVLDGKAWIVQGSPARFQMCITLDGEA